MASRAAGDEEMAVKDMNPQRRSAATAAGTVKYGSADGCGRSGRAAGRSKFRGPQSATRRSAQSEKPDLMHRYWWTGVLWAGVLVEYGEQQ